MRIPSKNKINRILQVFLLYLVCHAPYSFAMPTCPAGFTAGIIDWETNWLDIWDETLGPHVMTVSAGIQVEVEFNVTGGCPDSDFLRTGRPSVVGSGSDAELSTFPNWQDDPVNTPNGCGVDMTLDFSFGAIPLNVQEVSFTVKDIDAAGNRDEQVKFNGASSILAGADITTITDGGHGTRECTNTDSACWVTGTWSGPISSVSFTFDNGPSASSNPNAGGVRLTDVDFCYPDSVPVTLNSFASSQLGDRITVDWETLSESFNLGFTLWAKVVDDWVEVSKLISSNRIDSATQSDYRQVIDTSSLDYEITEIALSSVDTNGGEEFYGPFIVGEAYGSQAITEPIKWSPIRDAYERALAAKNYRKVGRRWRKQKKTVSTASIAVEEDGIYLVSYEDLKAHGIDFAGIPKRQIAVSSKGKPVPRQILSTSKSRKFGQGDAVVFHGGLPSGSDRLYLENRVYQISNNRTLVSKTGRIRKPLKSIEGLQTIGLETIRIEENNAYDEFTPSDDPWTMDRLLAMKGGSDQRSYSFDYPNQTSGAPVNVKIQLNSITNLEEVDQDGDGMLDDEHHVQVFVNGESTNNLIIEDTNDGTQAWTLSASFPDTLLNEGENTLTIKALGDTGYNFSLLYIDYAEVTVNKVIESSKNVIKFTALPTEGGFAAKSDIAGKIYGFTYTSDGNLARVKVKRDRKTQLLKISGISETDFAASYWVAAKDGFLSPSSIWASDQKPLQISPETSYLIIADPALIGADLLRFIDHRSDNGHAVTVVSVDDIVDRYGFGMKTPEAFTNFLKNTKKAVDFTHLLLIGGHTYDYRNLLNAEVAPINMIPTFYRRTHAIANFTPTDLPFADTNADGKPDIALGRWPVRTAEELTTIINKTINYEKPGGIAESQTALLVAERSSHGIQNFSTQIDRVQPFIGVTRADGSLIPWVDITRIDVDTIENEGFSTGKDANNEARRRIRENLNLGQSVTIFAGHGSPTRWSNQNLFDWQNIQELENFDHPTQVATMACYTTYYQSPSTNSLAHQFLFDQAGAVSINGSMLLGSMTGNEYLLTKSLKKMISGMSMGEAVMQTKQEMIEKQLYQDTVITWTTLGDPALVLRP